MSNNRTIREQEPQLIIITTATDSEISSVQKSENDTTGTYFQSFSVQASTCDSAYKVDSGPTESTLRPASIFLKTEHIKQTQSWR